MSTLAWQLCSSGTLLSLPWKGCVCKRSGRNKRCSSARQQPKQTLKESVPAPAVCFMVWSEHLPGYLAPNSMSKIAQIREWIWRNCGSKVWVALTLVHRATYNVSLSELYPFFSTLWWHSLTRRTQLAPRSDKILGKSPGPYVKLNYDIYSKFLEIYWDLQYFLALVLSKAVRVWGLIWTSSYSQKNKSR